MVESIISVTTFENSYTGEPVTYPSSGTTDEIAIGGTLPVTLAGLWGFTSYYSTGSSTSSTHFYCMTGNSIYTTVASAVTIGEEGVNVVASPQGLIAEILGYSGYFNT